MFHIPTEERRGQAGGFGADDSYKILKNVMEKSGAKIEMSTGSKDQSLTFLITGKQEQVLKARRDLLAQFQVSFWWGIVTRQNGIWVENPTSKGGS